MMSLIWTFLAHIYDTYFRKGIKMARSKNQLDHHKNDNFVMFFREHMPELRWLSMENRTAYNIFMFLCEHMDRGNGLICPSSLLEDYFNISRMTVSRAIRHLYDNGFIDILKVGGSNAYIVNPSIAWTNKKDGIEYCQFNGTFLIDRKQNLDYSLENQRIKMKNYSSKAKQIPGQLSFATFTNELVGIEEGDIVEDEE